MRDPEGQRIEKRKVTREGVLIPKSPESQPPPRRFHYKFYTESGEEVPKKDICYFEVNEDGTEVRVRPFKRTNEITVVQEAPATSMKDFIEESIYELFHVEDVEIDRLYEEAERYFNEDLVGIALFSWGNGFIQYYAIVYPVLRKVFEKDKFVWVMKLSKANVEYQHLMDVPAQRVAEPPPTITQLPPLQSLIAE